MAAALTLLLSVAHAQTLTVLHNFEGADGSRPGAGLVMDRAGNLYGTTNYGGDINCNLAPGGGNTPGCGVVYQLKRSGQSWSEQVLHKFEAAEDDYLPFPGEPSIGPSGVVYGTTGSGGSSRSGSLFTVTPPATAPKTALYYWDYTVLYDFTGENDGAGPSRNDRLNFDQQGNVYGAASGGGVAGAGVIYELSRSGSSWTEAPLYSFAGGTDGSSPDGMTFDESGNIYGVTVTGGNQDCDYEYGCGTIYMLTPSGSGWSKTTLHVFQQGVDGGWPGPLIRDAAGNLYGLTEGFGPNNNGGTVWELSPSGGNWIFSVLYSFPNFTVEDSGPFRLTMDSAGALYGISGQGGAAGRGFVFELTPQNGGWAYTDIHDFGTAQGQSDGCDPQGAVVLDGSGNLYGATEWCAAGVGNVWEVTP
jgi:hypothetical protein